MKITNWKSVRTSISSARRSGCFKRGSYSSDYLIFIMLISVLCLFIFHPAKNPLYAEDSKNNGVSKKTEVTKGGLRDSGPYGNKIHNWIIINKYYRKFTKDEIEVLAVNYDLVIFGKGSMYSGHTESYVDALAGKIKKINPNTLILFYINSQRSDVNSTLTKRAVRDHEDWFLHDVRTNERVYSGASKYSAQKLYAMDITNPSYRNGFAKWAKEVVSKNTYDGVFVDGALSLFDSEGKLWKHNDWYYPYVFEKGQLRKISWNRVHFADEKGERIWSDCLRKLIKETKKKIGDKLLIYNGVRKVPWHSEINDIYLDAADGIVSEFMLFNCWRNNSCEKNEKYILREIDMMKDNPRKLCLLQIMLDRFADIERRYDVFNFAFATFLLGKSDYSFFKATIGESNLLRGALYTFRNSYPDLGPGIGAFYKGHNVYQRDFQRGRVLVNFGKSEQLIPLGRNYYLPDGKKVSSILMERQTGKVLTKYRPIPPANTEVVDDFEHRANLNYWYNPEGYFYKATSSSSKCNNVKHVGFKIVYDEETKSNVGKFVFNTGDTDRPWSDYQNGIMKNMSWRLDKLPGLKDVIKFRVKTAEDFHLTIFVRTTNLQVPEANLIYVPKKRKLFDTRRLNGPGHAIVVGIGENSTDAQWHTYSLKLSSAVQRALPQTQITQIMNLRINTEGTLFIDDIAIQGNTEMAAKVGLKNGN